MVVFWGIVLLRSNKPLLLLNFLLAIIHGYNFKQMIEGLRVLENRYANPNSRRAVAEVAEKQGVPVEPLTRSLNFYGETRVVLVNGGDGSVSWVANACIQQKVHPLFLIYPGGSEVGFHESVAYAGGKISTETLLNGATLPSLQEKALKFSPGMVDMGNGESKYFIHAASTWLVGERYAYYCEVLRQTLQHPRVAGRFRAGVASVLATLPYAHQLDFVTGEPALAHAQLGPYFGRIFLCKDQVLNSKGISFVTLGGRNWPEVFIKLSLLGLYALSGKPPHSSLVTVKPAIDHHLERHYRVNNANLDGDLHPLKYPGPYKIARSEQELSVLAVAAY